MTDPTGMVGGCEFCFSDFMLTDGAAVATDMVQEIAPASRMGAIGMGAGFALGTAVVSGPVVATALTGAGVNSTVAGVAGAAVTSGIVSAEVQTGIDVVNTGKVNVGNTLKAGAIGMAGGALTGSVPIVKGAELATTIAKVELGIAAGLAGTAAMNGGNTTGSDLLASAFAGATATVAVESIKKDNQNR